MQKIGVEIVFHVVKITKAHTKKKYIDVVKKKNIHNNESVQRKNANTDMSH